MKKAIISVISLMGLIFTCGSSFAAIHYVNPGDTIQDAIDSATHGDTIIVAEGTYYENIFFNGKNIVLTGTYPDSWAVVENTIIDGSLPDNPDTNSVITFDGSENEYCVLQGFTIQNGTGTKQQIYSSYYTCGGGILGNHTQATIKRNIITNNYCYWHGSALYLCDGVIDSNRISENESDCVGTLADCNATISNNIIRDNTADYATGCYNCDGIIINNTIINNNNITEHSGGILRFCGGVITNNILWGNWSVDGMQISSSSSPKYSCIQDWTSGGEGNINSNPRLSYNGYLTINSPCINTATDTDAPSEDIDVESRFLDAGVDIGADEFVDPEGDSLPDWIEALGIIEYGSDNDSDGMPNGYEYDNGLNPFIDDADSDIDDDGFSNYQEYLDGTDPQDPFSRAVLYTFYVSPTGGDTYPYLSWQDAANTIQNAIDASHSGDTVIVAEGIYYENINLGDRSIVLICTDPDSPVVVNNTIIDGSNSGSVVTFDGTESSRCVLAGFTIRNGNATYGGGIVGNGTFAAIEKNRIVGNYGSSGGGLYICNGIVQNNFITGNSSRYGGGLYKCDGTIQNNIISGNIAVGSTWSRGGGLYYCKAIIRNNTIVDNFAGAEGGGLWNCDGIIANCIIWDNV